jgi:hypothetical protein
LQPAFDMTTVSLHWTEILTIMHEVEALIAKSGTLATEARRFPLAAVCPLVQGFSLLPITDALAGALGGYRTEPMAPTKPIPYISDGLRAFASDISHLSFVAYVSTYYFGGLGGQDALVWEKGILQFSPTSPGYGQKWPNSPISQALRMIGVVAEPGMDEFDTVGLGKHRETHRWAESVK